MLIIDVWLLAYIYSSSLQANSKAELQLGLRVSAHLALSDFHLDDPIELSVYDFAIDDSTISIVLLLLLLLFRKK